MSGGPAPSGRDIALVAAQLERDPRPFVRVRARCPWGSPAVVENAPYDDDGTPFPTLLWATCPSFVAAVARLESEGGVGRFERLVAADAALAASLSEATRYERRRRRKLAQRCPAVARDGGAALRTGIGGVADPRTLKCLHAHAAHALVRPSYALGTAILEQAAPLWGAACCLRETPLRG